jgi:hypothetical protein
MRCLNITITLLDIIQRPVFYLKRDVQRLNTDPVFRFILLIWAHEMDLHFFLTLATNRGERLALSTGPNWEVPPEDEDRIQSPNGYVLSKQQGDG